MMGRFICFFLSDRGAQDGICSSDKMSYFGKRIIGCSFIEDKI